LPSSLTLRTTIAVTVLMMITTIVTNAEIAVGFPNTREWSFEKSFQDHRNWVYAVSCRRVRLESFVVFELSATFKIP